MRLVVHSSPASNATTLWLQATKISPHRARLTPSRSGSSLGAVPSLSSFCPLACSSHQEAGTFYTHVVNRSPLGVGSPADLL